VPGSGARRSRLVWKAAEVIAKRINVLGQRTTIVMQHGQGQIVMQHGQGQYAVTDPALVADGPAAWRDFASYALSSMHYHDEVRIFSRLITNAIIRNNEGRSRRQ
jgi:hypothetical protein